MNNSNLKIFGIAFILSVTSVIIANYAIYDTIHIAGNLELTIKNLLEKEQLFRIAIFLDLLYVVLFVVAFTSFYIELKTVNSSLALIGLIMQLLYIFIFLAVTIEVLELFRFLNSQIHLQDPDRFKQIVRNFLGFRFDRYYGALPMHSLGNIIFSYLLFKTTFTPKSMAMIALISWIICAVCSFSLFAISGFMKNVNFWVYDTLSLLSFLLIGGYFIFKPFKNK